MKLLPSGKLVHKWNYFFAIYVPAEIIYEWDLRGIYYSLILSRTIHAPSL